MSNLPAKQSVFAKMRNKIIDAGLRNSFTRRLMINFSPRQVQENVIDYVFSIDDYEYIKLQELITEMNESTIKKYFLKICYRLCPVGDPNFNNRNPINIINQIPYIVPDGVSEFVTLTMINHLDPWTSEIAWTEETYQKMANLGGCERKSNDEIQSILEQLQSSKAGKKVAFYMFENLTLQQKKEHFSTFVELISTPNTISGERDLSKLFEQFPKEDRLEQYKKLLNVYSKSENSKNIYNITNCFEMLNESERVTVLDESFKHIEKSKMNSKATNLSKMISLVPLEEKEKYYKSVLNYCKNSIAEVKSYVSVLDSNLQKEIVSEVISKLREIKDTTEESKLNYKNEVIEIFQIFEPSVINQALVNILNGNVDNQDFKFVVDLLSQFETVMFIESTMQKGTSINPNQIEQLEDTDMDLEGLALLCVNTESDRIVQEFLTNPDESQYLELVQKIVGIAKNVKLTNRLRDKKSNTVLRLMLTKKIDSIMNLFTSLDNRSKMKFFNETVNALLDLNDDTYDLNRELADKIETIYNKLEEKARIEQCPRIWGEICKRFPYGENGKILIKSIYKNMTSEFKDAMYKRCIYMFNEGYNSDSYQKIRHILKINNVVEDIKEVLVKDDNISFLTEETLEEILKQKEEFNGEQKVLVNLYVTSRLKKIVHKHNKLDEESKKQNIDSVLKELSKPFEVFNIHKLEFEASRIQLIEINEFFSSLDKEEKEKHFNSIYMALNNIENLEARSIGYRLLYKELSQEEKVKRFPELIKQLKYDEDIRLTLFSELDDDSKAKMFEQFIISSPDNYGLAVNILKKYSIKELNEIFKGKVTIDEEKIIELMALDERISVKTLLFDDEIDRERIIDLDSYAQLSQSDAININSVIQNLYTKCQGKSKEEFNYLLSEAYNLFTYNNVPDFMKNFRIFQLGAFHNKQNDRIKSFTGKTIEERDILILEDLFKISLDSNNRSLRDFANIIIEGKQITTKLQSNPEEKIKSLDIEELALLNQYRDTLFDLHNLTKDIRNTDRPKIEKSDDVIKDLRTLIAIYSNNKEHNPNSKNVVFNPNKIMDELFDGFITTTIRPNAMLEYMERKKNEADERHLRIEQQLEDGTMHLEPGDFIKGVKYFDEYLPSMLNDGVKGGEFNQENSHSDSTPYDADFGYVSQANIIEAKRKKDEEKKKNSDDNNDLDITDYDVIETTISSGYGNNYIVLKQYTNRLQDRSKENFDQGTFCGSPDYYAKTDAEEKTDNDRYIRTGIAVTDIDYIVSENWEPQYGYEMAMAGIYIPVINPKGEVVFTSDEYKKIREEMRGLSHYSADNIVVSKDAANMEALYAIYRNISKKSPEEVEKEIETVKGIVDGKIDTITEQKKKAITQFIKDFFKTHGIRVADDLSQNLSSKSVELIDTGSTGRGTNMPGDGDFDFMLRHNLPEKMIEALATKVKTLVTPDSEFIPVSDGFRTKNVVLPTGEVVDIDVTTAKKSLSLVYSSDMCVRDRLNNIRENNPESYNYVQANIIMAKKILKAAGIYKKYGSSGATEHGGFGGIGVENWILQNGGSFKTAIDTFLQAAKESNSYDEFTNKYPIFDFGFNHRDANKTEKKGEQKLKKIRHDRFSAFFTNKSDKPGVGFEYAKVTLTEIQKAFEMEKEQQKMNSPLLQSISPEGLKEAGAKRPVLTFRSSYSRMRMLLAKHMSLRTKDTEQQVTIDRKGEEVLDD